LEKKGGIGAWASKNSILLAVAAVLVLALGIVFYFIADSGPDTDPKRGAINPPVQTSPSPGPVKIPSSIGGDPVTDRNKIVQINVEEGPAEVYRDGTFIGKTPLNLNASVGEVVKLMLKRDGCEDKRLEFAVTANQRGYTLQMEKKR